MVSLFPDALAAPRYLILGRLRYSGSPSSLRGSSGPPFSQAGAGGAAPPRGAVGFSNTNTAPPVPPPSRGPAPPRANVLPLGLRPASCRSLSRQRGCQIEYLMWVLEFGGSTYYDVRPQSQSSKLLFHLDQAPLQSKPRPPPPVLRGDLTTPSLGLPSSPYIRGHAFVSKPPTFFAPFPTQ